MSATAATAVTAATTAAPPAAGAAGTPPDTTPEALDAALERLAARAEAWFALPAGEKLRYVRATIAGTARVAAAQVRAACAAKGHPFDGPLAAEDWFGGPVAQLRGLRLLARTLERVAAGGPAAAVPRRVRDLPDGRLAVDVLPTDWRDRVLFAGVRGEVWLRPGTTRAALARQVAALYGPDPRAHGLAPGVAAVLGAGNVAAIGPLDVVHKLFAEGQTAVLKFNPVNAYLGPFFEEAFADLVRDGYVAAAYGAADVGARLTGHPRVASVHITGSRATHDAIVWGAGDEAARRRAEGRPRLAKPITSELGNVTPVIVVPGRWGARDLRMQAEHVATQMTQNAGFNCVAAKALVVHEGWPQRGAFLDALRAVLRALPGRPAYYPGAADRWARFTAAHPGHEALGTPGAGRLPPTLLAGLDPADRSALAFREESFCAVTGVVALPGRDAADFLGRAVTFANDVLDGTLGACLLVDPAAERALGPALGRAVAELRYGTVGVNVWPGVVFALGATPWGAYPGHTLADVGSGIGAVHDPLLLGPVEKSVVRGPFGQRLRPPGWVTHPGSHRVGEALVAAEAGGGLGALVRVAAAAL
jgi:acyl-CoA reductase-like NAD-dependent aldehyde dehydrogenase